MKFDIELSKREIVRRAEGMVNAYQAMNQRQVDSINRLLGHVQDEMPQVPMYESELMHLNDMLAKADVIHTALIEVITRIRHHAQDTGNVKLLDIIGDIGRESHELETGGSSGAKDPFGTLI